MDVGRNGDRGLTTLWLPCLPWLATLSLLLGIVWPGLAGVALAQGQPPPRPGGATAGGGADGGRRS